ncbi:hypothetical protein N2597_22530 (plasmid) [Rhizobium sophoriradicis]|uniref:hypothetical protein n=1 Tax=Rhizobium sophoriradicis TaxID=1535245 RepID=UPI00161BFE67|nr:hypothetical protein N2597_22530 [Rhizobium leguminosarum bv. phaseoli]
MANDIRRLFIIPPMAVARLGSSTTAVEAYNWADVEVPRYDGKTTIVPDWTLAVEVDGSLRPYKPTEISFRDGDRIRPVAPFFEIWASTGTDGSAPDTWVDCPLSEQLLDDNGFRLEDVVLRVEAANRKAARRAGNAALVFGTKAPIELTGANYGKHSIEGRSPASTRPMIPENKSIPLGHVQFVRATNNVEGHPWFGDVDLETIRFRLWPAAGEFYGPPQAAEARPELGRNQPAVRKENAFLDDQAGWYGASTLSIVAPPDTYDSIDSNTGSTGPSLGVVDDTCEVHFTVRLTGQIGDEVRPGRAAAFVAPPDFAPDRRPFLSVADEFNDRAGDWQQRNDQMSGEELEDWIEDFFERVYETVSLFNLDDYVLRRAIEILPDDLRPKDLDGGSRPRPQFALGGRDPLRNPLFPLPGSTAQQPLPMSTHAKMRHRDLADLQGLEKLVAATPDRILELVRPPFFVGPQETRGASSMQMPPFMRQSNAEPLTVVGWQHELLKKWIAHTQAKPKGARMLGTGISEKASRRRKAVLASLDLG